VLQAVPLPADATPEGEGGGAVVPDKKTPALGYNMER
jgi:hypothetical protein